MKVIFSVISHVAVVEAVVAINGCLGAGDKDSLLAALQSPAAGLRGVTPECAQAYFTELRAAEGEKELAGKSQTKKWIYPYSKSNVRL